jgi:hypothetical protein
VTYRVGNHQPQNVYRDDAYIGVMFTAEDAALAVEALNGRAELLAALAALVDPDPCSYDHSGKCQAHGQGSDPVCAHARARELLSGQPGPRPIRLASGGVVLGPIAQLFSSGCVIEPPVEHRAETPGGDGLGYGRCVGCGEMWPCMPSRSAPASTCLGCNVARRNPGSTCPRHGAVM